MTKSESDISLEEGKRQIGTAIVTAFQRAPPTIAVIGLSGTGKSSTLNALFGQRLPVSHSTRGTVAFTKIALSAKPKDPQFGELPFVFMDAPGLGEDVDKDPEYLDAYERHLPECDVILWVLSARNRALALDQNYLRRFDRFSDRIVLGINQCDLVHPNDWSSTTNLPSVQQAKTLDEIYDDRKARLNRILNCDIPTVMYSAAHSWRLVELLNLVMSRCSSKRRFMFDMLSHVRPDDFLPSQLSEKDRKEIMARVAEAETNLGRKPEIKPRWWPF